MWRGRLGESNFQLDEHPARIAPSSLRQTYQVALGFLALLFAGCYGQPPSFDPFLGRTTVPPPGTVEYPSVTPGQPYYQGAPSQLPTSPPVYQNQPPSTILPSTPSIGAPGTPPPAGAYRFPQSSIDRSKATKPGPDEYLAGQSSIARRSPVVQTLQPRSDSAVSPAGSLTRAPQTASAAQRMGGQVNRSPAVASRNLAPSRSISTEPGRFIAPQGAKEVSGLPFRPPRPTVQGTTAERRSRFDYDTQYSWIRGRLEFLESRQQWKLRYIPIDGDTDRFGGSVLISNAASIDKFRPGSFVELRGSIKEVEGDNSSFAPEFHVTEASLLANE